MRRSPRAAASFAARVDGRPARVIDVSSGGALLETGQPLEVGATCALELVLPDGAATAAVRARVVREAGQSAGGQRCGLELDARPEIAERIRGFVERSTGRGAPNEVERRARAAKLAALDAAPFALLILDQAGRIVDANRSAETLVGRPLAELQGRALADLLWLPRGRDRGLALEDLLGDPRQGLRENRFLSWLRSERGPERGVEVWAKPISGLDEPLAAVFLDDLGFAPERRAVADTETANGTPARETILVAEDEPALRELMRDVLEDEGYRVLVAADGPAALELARRYRGPIHLLLSDVVMPGMDGRSLIERVAAARPGVRALLMSGYVRPREGGPGVLPAPLLEKPFTPDALARRVRALLDGDE